MNCKRLKRTPCADRCNIETLLSRSRILRRFHWTLCALAGGYIAASAQAAMMTTIKFQPNSADINDLEHRLAIHGGSMVSARAFLPSPALRSPLAPSPGDANPNVRQFPLLDAAINPGIDNFTGSTLVANLNDACGSIRYHSDSKWHTQAGSADTFLANSTFDLVVSHRQTLAAHMTDGRDWVVARGGLPFLQRRHQV